MHRSPLALAALATVAVPGLDPWEARGLSDPDDDTDVALVADARGRRWVVRCPTDAASGAALEREIAVLGALSSLAADGTLPFQVPSPAGFAALTEGGRALVHERIGGDLLDTERLEPGPGLAASLGRALAALHELPTGTAERLGLPAYTADEYRRRRLAEVDEAARTGHVPAALLARWERRLEDVSWWRFKPTVVHGDLVAERVLTSGGTVVGILGWGGLQVADPADDLAFVATAAGGEAAESVLEAYRQRRTELVDPHLADRAALAGELALVRWLLFGVATGDDEIVADAAVMLADLDAAVAALADETPLDNPAPDEGADDDGPSDDTTSDDPGADVPGTGHPGADARPDRTAWAPDGPEADLSTRAVPRPGPDDTPTEAVTSTDPR